METKSVGVARGAETADLVGNPAPPQIYTCPYTGDKYTLNAAGWRQPVPGVEPTLKLRYPVTGLTATKHTNEIRWAWSRPDAIDEADARDAQCRAGWNDLAYDFFDFKSVTQPDGSSLATWGSGVSCE